ncbi:MAG: PAS domain-containing protein [Hyphomicrobiaceae bacterium]
MRHTSSHHLFAYWNETRNGRPAPRRFDIEPSRISHLLADTLILEMTETRGFRFRLAGTRICEQFGTELRGADFFALWDEEGDRISLERSLDAICGEAKVGVFDFTAKTATGDVATFEMILLPLIHTRGLIDRCLGAISIAFGTVWTGDAPLTNHHLTSARLFQPEQDDGYQVGERPSLSSIRTARIVRAERRQFRVYDGGRAHERAHDD